MVRAYFTNFTYKTNYPPPLHCTVFNFQLYYFSILVIIKLMDEGHHESAEGPTSSTSTTMHLDSDECNEQIMVLQLNGVLDFEAVKKAAQNGTIRVRESRTESPLIQIGSSLYSGEWTQTLGTDLLFCVNNQSRMHQTGVAGSENWNLDKQQLELVAVSNTRLCSKKVLLTKDEPKTVTTTVVEPEKQQRRQSSKAKARK